MPTNFESPSPRSSIRPINYEWAEVKNTIWLKSEVCLVFFYLQMNFYRHKSFMEDLTFLFIRQMSSKVKILVEKQKIFKHIWNHFMPDSVF